MSLYKISLVQVILFCVFINLGETWEYVNTKGRVMKLIGGRWVEMDDTNEIRGNSMTTTTSNKVHITVFYESMCPGSIFFLTRQLKPAAEQLAPYLDIHLVPYGHAKTREVYGQITFQCQHGPQECYENKMHACAVDVIKNNTQAAIFNACLMTYSTYRKDATFDYAVVVNWCKNLMKIQTPGIWDCINSERSSILLKAYGEETQAIGLRYIPYILINNSTDKQDAATRDLSSTVCSMLHPKPPACAYLRY